MCSPRNLLKPCESGTLHTDDTGGRVVQRPTNVPFSPVYRRRKVSRVTCPVCSHCTTPLPGVLFRFPGPFIPAPILTPLSLRSFTLVKVHKVLFISSWSEYGGGVKGPRTLLSFIVEFIGKGSKLQLPFFFRNFLTKRSVRRRPFLSHIRYLHGRSSLPPVFTGEVGTVTEGRCLEVFPGWSTVGSDHQSLIPKSVTNSELFSH